MLSALLPLLAAAPAHAISIDNLSPRLDANGSIVNAHDGTIRWLDGAWWVHAASYGAGNCTDPPHTGCERVPGEVPCGFQGNHNVTMFRSPDLTSGSWEWQGDAVRCEDLPNCKILYRPHLVWNPRTRLYVLFYNYIKKNTPHPGSAAIGVATASSPAGPFTVRNHAISNARPVLATNYYGSMGDFDVFVDADDTAYIVYSFGPMSIEQLSPDYLNGTDTNASFPGGGFGGTVLPIEFTEAPSLWQRGETYFLTTGHCCCFCWQGSGMITYVASHPLGPWRRQPGPPDIGCVANSSNPTPVKQKTLPLTAQVSPGQGCNYLGARAASVSRAQQNFVLPIHTADGGVSYVWTGDRWMQAPDGTKAHEPQSWLKLTFAGEVLLPLRWSDTLELNVLVPQPPFPPPPREDVGRH